ncbi:TrbC/VirB2 family protein [Parachitinimonas caeni]|uniref:TrbC/VirB2 family protein n=1 Tax=Parachitinimonas caeni TaxID=3031301 RepID=A0ABT7E1R6_9NEIS|nr:TrbC/VirB2 family protein [Parachitinimonas caeni]MDK2126261.1 TrbC/VirB2 family protein [Parachitinimonas caeni]
MSLVIPPLTASRLAFRRRFLAYSSLILLLTPYAHAAQGGFSLGIAKPLCNMISSVSQEAAIIMALLGIGIAAWLMWGGEKGSKVMEGIIRTVAAVTIVLSLTTIVTVIFPAAQMQLCS